jgi:hypothetical protein
VDRRSHRRMRCTSTVLHSHTPSLSHRLTRRVRQHRRSDTARTPLARDARHLAAELLNGDVAWRNSPPRTSQARAPTVVSRYRQGSDDALSRDLLGLLDSSFTRSVTTRGKTLAFQCLRKREARTLTCGEWRLLSWSAPSPRLAPENRPRIQPRRPAGRKQRRGHCRKEDEYDDGKVDERIVGVDASELRREHAHRRQ